MRVRTKLPLIPVLALLSSLQQALADPLSVKFSSCINEYPSNLSQDQLLQVNEVYANLVPADVASYLHLAGDGRPVIRVDLLGTAGAEIIGYDNSTNKLATLFADSDAADTAVWDSTSWLCDSLFPADLPTPYSPDNVTYCPLPAGPFAINISIPLWRSYALTTIRTKVRVVDVTDQANTLACYNLEYTPWSHGGWYYALFRWIPVAIAIGFWITTWGARLAAGYLVGSGVAEYGSKEGGGMGFGSHGHHSNVKRDATMRKWGTMIVSGLSGERLSVSGGLLRFVTPGLRDILVHIQFVTILGMIAVNWPQFAYPIITRGAWADLVGNITVFEGAKHISPLPNNYTAPSAFKSMMSNPKYPLYLDPDSDNHLLDLGNANPGMQSFAATLGLYSQDLFGTCLIIFLALVAGVTLLSLLLWVLHGFVEYLSADNPVQRPVRGSNPRLSSLGSSPRGSFLGKEVFDPHYQMNGEDYRHHALAGSHHHQSTRSVAPSKLRKTWWRFRPKGEAGAFHFSALYGNLLRMILMFHLPITTFAIYQLTFSRASTVSRVFAALVFVFVSVLIPAFIMLKINRTPTGKLYDATRTLLALGPMYNVYVEGKQMFRVMPLTASLIEGIAIGAGQKSGLAQTVILIVVELVMLILSAVWYPWGEGASMGAPTAMLGVIRVVSLVLVMLLSSTLGIASSVTDWIAYAILILQAIVFLMFIFMLLTKIVEGLIRLSGGVHFDESTSPLDGGLFAAIMDLNCLNAGRGGKAAERKRRKRGSQLLQKNVAEAGSLTTQRMLDRNSLGITRVMSGDIAPYQPDVTDAGTSQSGPGYLPIYQPPLGPPPTHGEKRSFEDDQGANEPIMSSWRPPSQASAGVYGNNMASSSTSPPPGRSFSVVRGGRSDYQNPYSVKEASEAYARAASPSRSAYGASPTSQDSVPNLYPGAQQNGMRRNSEGLAPPMLTIPKRRSLNNLREDPSPSSEYPSPSSTKKKKRFSGRFGHWFSRDQEPDSSGAESDDEPDPTPNRANPRPFESVPSPLRDKREKGWRAALGLTKRKEMDDVEERARDENKVRKDALAAQSGSLFAGVDAPRSGFVVHRKGAPRSAAATPSSSRPGTSHQSRSLDMTPGSSTPLRQSQQRDSVGEPEKSFKVKRLGQTRPAPVSVPDGQRAPSTITVDSGESPILKNDYFTSEPRSTRDSVQSQSLPTGLKRSSNVAKSPTGETKSASGGGRRQGSGGGLWGDLGEFGASHDSTSKGKGRSQPSKRGSTDHSTASGSKSPISPNEQRHGQTKTFRVNRPQAYVPPTTFTQDAPTSPSSSWANEYINPSPLSQSPPILGAPASPPRPAKNPRRSSLDLPAGAY